MAHYQTGICQNCSTTLNRELLLAGKNFCGEKCTQTASLVRYCRNRIKEAIAIMRRVHAEEPTRLCDNAVLWDKVWREIASANKASGMR